MFHSSAEQTKKKWQKVAFNILSIHFKKENKHLSNLSMVVELGLGMLGDIAKARVGKPESPSCHSLCLSEAEYILQNKHFHTGVLNLINVCW